MDAIFIAKLLGPVWLLVGLGFLFNRKFYGDVIKDLVKSNGLVYLAGVCHFILGLYFVLNHNVWELSINGLITVLIWAMLLKGALIVLLPGQMLKQAERMMKCKNALLAAGSIALLGGATLTYFAYFAV